MDDKIFTGSLDVHGQLPLYAQLVSQIKRAISSGRLEPGERLPSETELCRSCGISRSTVRQAIGLLEDEGLLVRRQGLGTFIIDPATRRRENVYSFTSEIRGIGRVPTSTILNFELTLPRPSVADMLDIGLETPIYLFSRVRNVDGEPVIIETSCYPASIYPNLTRELLETHSFYSLLYEEGVVPYSAEDRYSATTLSEEEAKLLEASPGAPAFAVERRTGTESGVVYEYTKSILRGDKVRLSLKYNRDETSFRRLILARRK